MRSTKWRNISAPRSWSDKVYSWFDFQHIQRLHLKYFEVAWKLVFSGTKVQLQKDIWSRLPSRLSFRFFWLCLYTLKKIWKSPWKQISKKFSEYISRQLKYHLHRIRRQIHSFMKYRTSTEPFVCHYITMPKYQI